MRLREEGRQHPRQFVLLVEKTRAADADRVVTADRQRLRQSRFVKDKGGFSRGEAAGELSGKQAGMGSLSQRRWQEAREEGVVSSIGEASRGVALFPASLAEIGCQCFEPSLLPSLLCGIESQRVQREEQDVSLADQMLHCVCSSLINSFKRSPLRTPFTRRDRIPAAAAAA